MYIHVYIHKHVKYIHIFIYQSISDTVLTKILFEVYVHMHFSNSTSKSNRKHMSYESDYLLDGTIDMFINTHMTRIAQDKRYIGHI